jgi:tetratricopeptide repeat protein
MYLRRAVDADPGYTHARLDLARAYVNRKDLASARIELGIILQQPISQDASAFCAWRMCKVIKMEPTSRIERETCGLRIWDYYVVLIQLVIGQAMALGQLTV